MRERKQRSGDPVSKMATQEADLEEEKLAHRRRLEAQAELTARASKTNPERVGLPTAVGVEERRRQEEERRRREQQEARRQQEQQEEARRQQEQQEEARRQREQQQEERRQREQQQQREGVGGGQGAAGGYEEPRSPGRSPTKARNRLVDDVYGGGGFMTSGEADMEQGWRPGKGGGNNEQKKRAIAEQKAALQAQVAQPSASSTDTFCSIV